MSTTTEESTVDVVRKATRELARGFDLEYWRQKDKKGEYPREFVKAFADGGWLGLIIPEEYGGLGLGMTEAAVMLYEISASGAANSGASAIHFSIFPPAPILGFGSEEMKKQWLPKIASGEILMCFAITEPTAGVDTSRIRTMAKKVDGGWVINGQKVWISNAQNAHKILLLARTSPRDEANPLDGMTIFFTDLNRDHITVREIEKAGRSALDSNELFIDNLPVRDDEVVGEVGKGFQYLHRRAQPGTHRRRHGADRHRPRRPGHRRPVRQGPCRVRPSHRQEPGRCPPAGRLVDPPARPPNGWPCTRPSLFDTGQKCGKEAAAAKFLGAEAGFEACDRAMRPWAATPTRRSTTSSGCGVSRRLQLNAPFSQEMVLNFVSHNVLKLPRSY